MRDRLLRRHVNFKLVLLWGQGRAFACGLNGCVQLRDLILCRLERLGPTKGVNSRCGRFCLGGVRGRRPLGGNFAIRMAEAGRNRLFK